jgi:hypothetical protein
VGEHAGGARFEEFPAMHEYEGLLRDYAERVAARSAPFTP